MSDKLDISIGEGETMMIMAAYSIGKGDVNAEIPKNILVRCVKFIQAESDEEAQKIIEGME